MVTEWEREELGRLTHSKLKSLSSYQQEQQLQPGRMTLQNIEQIKTVSKQADTKQAKIKLLLERLKMAVTTSLQGIFAPSDQRLRDDRCKVYGHNLPFGTNWKGVHPKCLDCGAKITDASQLRGAMPITEREKFRGYGER